MLLKILTVLLLSVTITVAELGLAVLCFWVAGLPSDWPFLLRATAPAFMMLAILLAILTL